MRRRRGVASVAMLSLALLLALTTLLQPAATLAQGTSSGQLPNSGTVGSSTVSWSDDWEAQTVPGAVPQLMLLHATIPDTLYVFTETRVPEAQEANDTLVGFATGFFSEFGDGAEQPVTVGGTTSIIDDVETRLSWRLYALPMDSVPYGVLLTANAYTKPGTTMLSVVVAPAGSMDLAVRAVQETVTIDNQASPLVGMDPEDLAEDLEAFIGQGPAVPTEPDGTPTPGSGGLTLPPLGGTAVPSSQAAPTDKPDTTPTSTRFDVLATPTATLDGLTLPPLDQTEPAATETSGGLTLPPLATTPAAEEDLASTSLVSAEVRYSDDWVLDEENSRPNEVVYLDVASGGLRFYGLTVEESTGLQATTALLASRDIYFGSVDATEVEELERAAPSEGTAWALYRATIGGFQAHVLMYVDTMSTPGQIQYNLLVTDPAGMSEVLELAQDTLLVDGTPAFADVDPALVRPHAG